MNKENFIADDTFTSECEELLKDLNVNIGGNYRVVNIEAGIDDAWLDEFVEEYNF